MEEPIRVLHIVGAMYPGGFENFIMNLYENMYRDKIQFDIVVHMRKENDYVDKIKQMGGRVYELPRLTGNPIANLKQLYRIVKDNQYKIMIRHTSNALVVPQLFVAKKAGAKVICHSHNETDPKVLLHKLGKLFMDVSVNERFACSENAGLWMFGKKTYKVVHNAISIDKFLYRAEAGNKIRKEFGLSEKKVYGHIANFIQSKNHMFLLSIYKEISKIDESAVFFCVGEGDLRPEIEEEIKRLEMQDKVILTGIRKDVPDFMSCFNVLVFPSKFEGLPLTLIEAQAAGLPCLISDTITKDVIVTENLVEMESIEQNPSVWAKRAISMSEKRNRECQYESIAKAGYDIKTLAKEYENLFEELAK